MTLWGYVKKMYLKQAFSEVFGGDDSRGREGSTIQLRLFGNWNDRNSNERICKWKVRTARKSKSAQEIKRRNKKNE